MSFLYAITLFLSALLLFLVQPLMGRLLLPWMGGAPAVWNTCMVFFQFMLLAGYLYAHLSTGRLGVRRQAAFHLGLLALPVLLLVWGLSRSPQPLAPPHDLALAASDSGHPVFPLLLILLVTVGLPFFVLASTAPLLQRWFASAGQAGSADPYFLYAASNLGSLLGLLGYPGVVEPRLTLADQTWFWCLGYGGFAVLTVGCAFALWSTNPTPAEKAEEAEPPPPLTWRRRLLWLALAAMPSSLLLGVTTHITTDLAPVPLLWVVPLALYLLTFVLAFARWRVLPPIWLGRVQAITALVLVLSLVLEATEPLVLLLPLHLLTFFVACLVCHYRLADDRPDPRHLTEFYLWLSAGGVLGGIFNTLLAPVLFSHVGMIDYPMALLLACMFMPAYDRSTDRRARVLDLVFPAGVALVGVTLVLLTPYFGLETLTYRNAAAFALPTILAYMLVDRPVRYALGLGALFVAGAADPGTHGRTLYLERNFFGVLRVTRDPVGDFHRLVHGNIVHGRQNLERPDEPLTYYGRKGPFGLLFAELDKRPDADALRVAVVGLGAGEMACYARPGQQWTFYEINPAVERVARNPALFTYLSRHFPEGEGLRVVLGDARLRLESADDGAYDLLVVDAFSSDAIPVHLLTTQAVGLYVQKLRPGGVLAFHVSNNYLDLKPVLARLALELGLEFRTRDDFNWTRDDLAEGKNYSQWVVLARNEEDLGRAATTWLRFTDPMPARVWTDDYCDLLGALQLVSPD